MKGHVAPADPNADQLFVSRGFRSLTVGVRALLIDEEQKRFLVRHTYCAGWHLPGGGVEVGETLECALRRELKEEAGVELTGPPALHGLYLNISASPRDHVALYASASFSFRSRRSLISRSQKFVFSRM